MKWENNEVKFTRGDYEVILARFDDDCIWYMPRALMTQQSAKHLFRDLGKALDAKKVEVRKFSNKKINKNDIRVVDEWGGAFKFWDFETLSKYNYELKIKK